MSDEQWIPGNKAELMSVIEREWKLLMDVVAKLDVTKMVTPDAGGWSPKDNLAHLGEWMNIMMGYHMDGRPSHEVVKMDPKITKDWDFEVINQILFERHRNRPVDEVLNELKRIYSEVMAKLNSTPFEDLLKPRFADDPEKRPLLLWILGNTTEHFVEHRVTIEKML